MVKPFDLQGAGSAAISASGYQLKKVGDPERKVASPP
jgi:hypothetical protein